MGNVTATSNPSEGAATTTTSPPAAPLITTPLLPTTPETVTQLISHLDTATQQFIQLGAMLGIDQPTLPDRPALPPSPAEMEAWFSTAGFDEAYKAQQQVNALSGQGQKLAALNAATNALSMFTYGMQQAQSMIDEGNLQAAQTLVQASKDYLNAGMAVVSGVFTAGLAAKDSLEHTRAQFKTDTGNEIGYKDAIRLKMGKEIQIKDPGAAKPPAVFNLKNISKKPLSEADRQELSQSYQQWQSINTSVTQFVTGIASGILDTESASYSTQIAAQKAIQQADSTMIQLLQSTNQTINQQFISAMDATLNQAADSIRNIIGFGQSAFTGAI